MSSDVPLTQSSMTDDTPAPTATNPPNTSTDELSKPTRLSEDASSSAIGPPLAINTHNTGTAATAATPASKSLHLTLLLIVGAKHPFHLDEKYLGRRQVKVEDMDPWNLSVWQLKELIHLEWRDDFEAKPDLPNSIRLIYMGTVLDDDRILKDLRLNHDTPNIIHLSVKPDLKLEDEGGPSKSGSRRDSREDDSPTAGCCARCTIL